MKPASRPISPQRLQRFVLWTALMLAWAGEVVSGVMQRFRAGRALEARVAVIVPKLRRIIMHVLIIEALIRYGAPTLNIHKRFRTDAHTFRALVGPAIRRLVRGRTLGERIARLAHMLRDRATIVEIVAARIARGLTQAHIAPPRAPLALIPAAPALAHAAADTS